MLAQVFVALEPLVYLGGLGNLDPLLETSYATLVMSQEGDWAAC